MTTFDPTPYLTQPEGQYFDRKSLWEGLEGHKRCRDRRTVRDQIAKYVAAFAFLLIVCDRNAGLLQMVDMEHRRNHRGDGG